MRLSTRLATYAISTTVALGGALTAAGPASAADPNNPSVQQGAAWLAGQLDGGMFTGDFSQGLSIDSALALDAVGGHDAAVVGVNAALRPVIGDYIQFQGHVFAGSAAKAAVMAQVAGDNPRAYNGFDLIGRVEDVVGSAAPIVGKVPETNVLGQAFAARALAAAQSPKADDVRDFLLKQQCASGFFRESYNQSDTALQQGCVQGDAPSIDATAIAVLQLEPQAGTPVVATALSDARAWLATQQDADGSFGAGTGQGANANTTGLAGWALHGTNAAAKAAQWLRARQVTFYDVCDQLLRERGAIAYDKPALVAGRTDGITDPLRDQWRRATAQALPALRDLPATQVAAPRLSQPSGFYKEGAHPVLTVSGSEAGVGLCFTGPGIADQFVATGGSITKAVTLPAGTATRGYAVRDADGQLGIARIAVLGQKTLVVARTPGYVHRYHTVTVAIHGLAANEPSRIVYGGRVVRSGPASASGNLVGRFSVGGSLGRHSILGYGRFSDIRAGLTSVTVVR